MKLNIWNIYLRKGMIYVPTVARAEAGGHLGYFMDIDPVKVIPITGTETLRHALVELMSKGNLIVPAPSRASFPKPVILKYANVKSWSAFEKDALYWKIVEKDGSYQIKPGRRRDDRGWEDDLAKTEFLVPGTTLDEVALRATSLVQSALGDRGT